jgi:hypothetical protein
MAARLKKSNKHGAASLLEITAVLVTLLYVETPY